MVNGQVCGVGRVRSVKVHCKIPSVFYNIAIRWKNLSSLLNSTSNSITYFWPWNVTCIINNIGKVVYLVYGTLPSQHEHYIHIINCPLYLCTWTRYFIYDDKYFNKKITHLYTKPEHEVPRLLILRTSSLCLSHFISIISTRTDIKAKEYYMHKSNVMDSLRLLASSVSLLSKYELLGRASKYTILKNAASKFISKVY